jgi:hypothetical protein
VNRLAITLTLAIAKPSRLHRTNYWRTNAMTRKASGWTPKRRARQAEKIRNWRPWEAATGPSRTADGKARFARKHGGRTASALAELAAFR